MKKTYLSYLLMIGAFLTIIEIANGQQLATKWTTNVTGERVSPQHMAVVPETRHRYLVTSQGDDQFNLVHLDQDGNEIWNTPERGGFHPNKLVYTRGKIFLIGISGLAGASVVPMLVRMYEDLGSGPTLVWEYEIIAEASRTIYPETIIADPRGEGVIFGYLDRTYDGSDQILKTRRISTAREVVPYDDFNLGAYAVGALPAINAMCVDVLGNVYLTGLSNAVPLSSDPGYINPSTEFVVKFNYAGRREWSTPISETGFNLFGYDIGVDASGVYVVGHRMPAGPGPLPTSLTMLTKLRPATGEIERSISLPSRTWDWQSRQRKSLLIDGSGPVIAYNAPDETGVTVQSFNRSLVRQWTHNIPLLSGAYFASLISPGEGRLAIGINDELRFATRLVITTLTREGVFVDRYESTIGGVVQMEPDPTGEIHIGGTKRERGDGIGIFEQVLEYRPRYRALPTDVFATPYILMELKSQGRLQHWGSFNSTWTCLSIPCNASFMASMTGSNASWKEIITKPTMISLPQDANFKTFRFSLQDKSASKLLFEIDRSLVDNGIKSLKVETDWNYATLTLTSTTDGADIPLTLSLIGKNGNTIAELKTIAPGRKVFADRVAEPVSHIRITAPAIAPTVSVYPNPSNGKFKVTLDQAAIYPIQLSIYNGQGTKVHQQVISSPDTDVALNNPLPGFYVIRVTDGKVNLTTHLQIK